MRKASDSYPLFSLPAWRPLTTEGKKPKNILVADCCSLIWLSSLLPERFFDPATSSDTRPKTYLDLLWLLPPSMVEEVHIPDVVVAEYIGYLSMKSDTKGAVISRPVDTRFALRFPEQQKIRKAFMEKALQGKDPFVKISHSEAGQIYLGEWAFEAAQLESLREPDGTVQKWHRPEFKKQLMQLMDLQHGEGADLGEMFCARLCLLHAIENHGGATLLTEDRWGHALLAHNLDIYPNKKNLTIARLNVRGLLVAMEKRGVLANAGIVVSADELIKQMNIERSQVNSVEKFPKYHDYLEGKKGGFVERWQRMQDLDLPESSIRL